MLTVELRIKNPDQTQYTKSDVELSYIPRRDEYIYYSGKPPLKVLGVVYTPQASEDVVVFAVTDPDGKPDFLSALS